MCSTREQGFCNAFPHMKTTTPLRHSTNRSFFRVGVLVTPLMLACFALSPQARATCQKGCGTHFNTVLGDDVLVNNTSGSLNTAIGSGALTFNTTGFDNTANGATALYSNTTGNDNTAIGAFALYLNTDGTDNTAVGDSALPNNTIGGANVAVGIEALYGNVTGNFNTALGFFAGYNTNGNTKIAVGYLAGQYSAGDNNIDIGNQGAIESGVIRIGTEGTHMATFVAGIRETPIAGAIQVGISADGQLGIRPSSVRFKEAVKPMDNASEAILSLKPVTFRYKRDLDPDGIPQFGLVAEEVEKIDPALVARDEQGKPYTVRYEAVNAMLLNEFLKEHKKVEEQQGTIAQLKSTVAQERESFEAKLAKQQEEIETLAAGLQKVSA